MCTAVSKDPKAGLHPPERSSSSCGGGNARRALRMVDVQVATERGGRDAGVGSGTGGQERGEVRHARRLAHTLPTRERRERRLAGVGSEEVAVAGRLGCVARLGAGPTGLDRLLELGDDVDGAVELAHDLVGWHNATLGRLTQNLHRRVVDAGRVIKVPGVVRRRTAQCTQVVRWET